MEINFKIIFLFEKQNTITFPSFEGVMPLGGGGKSQYPNGRDSQFKVINIEFHSSKPTSPQQDHQKIK
jgi:hypothetical protein